jgi:hypothetical protein
MEYGMNTFAPSVQYARFGGVVLPQKTATTVVVTTALTPLTLTPAQVLQGLLPVDCQDAATITTPTAVLLCAAIEGCQVGTSFDLDVINYGDTTLTIGLGTGVTKKTIATVAAVLTMITLVSKRLTFICTNATKGSEAWEVWAFGSTAAPVA